MTSDYGICRNKVCLLQLKKYRLSRYTIWSITFLRKMNFKMTKIRLLVFTIATLSIKWSRYLLQLSALGNMSTKKYEDYYHFVGDYHIMDNRLSQRFGILDGLPILGDSDCKNHGNNCNHDEKHNPLIINFFHYIYK